MGSKCGRGQEAREWTQEEKNAYLDWQKHEDDRVERLVEEEFRRNGTVNVGRGVRGIWRQVEEDLSQDHRQQQGSEAPQREQRGQRQLRPTAKVVDNENTRKRKRR